MKAIIGVLLVLNLCGCARDEAEEGEVAPSAIPELVRAELEHLGAEDQAIRQDLTAERMQDTVFAKEMLRGDSARSLRLREIVDEYGWPDSTRVGTEAANAAFLILQHSPLHDFQKEMLPTLEEHARRGVISPSDVAMLIDRVLMHAGEPQRYGTQFTLVDGKWVLHEVEDEDALEERRRMMQLPPMAEYARMLEEMTGAPVVGPKDSVEVERD